MSEAIIEAEGLTREFRVRDGRRRRRVVAVDGLSISVRPGESVGYIGANGAGKSTTIKMLTGILVPTAGTVRTCGLLASEAGGLRQRLAFDAEQTTAAKVLAAVSGTAEVLDLTVEEADIEDVVRRVYAASRQSQSG